jgi:hypothetical protein
MGGNIQASLAHSRDRLIDKISSLRYLENGWNIQVRLAHSRDRLTSFNMRKEKPDVVNNMNLELYPFQKGSLIDKLYVPNASLMCQTHL